MTFEEEFIMRILGDNEERDVKKWAGNVATHYGRKRRVDLLEKARKLTLAGGHGEFQVEVEAVSKPSQLDIVPQGSAHAGIAAVQSANDAEEEAAAVAWDFEDDGTEDAVEETPNGNGHAHGLANHSKHAAHEITEGEDAWNFDDEGGDVTEENESNSRPANGAPGHTNGDSKELSAQDQLDGDGLEDDGSDAWGWGDGNDDLNDATVPTSNPTIATSDDSKDDDLWDDSWNRTEPNNMDMDTSPVSSSKPIKVAKRLEKFSSKSKSNSPVLATSPHMTQNSATTPLSSSFTSSHTRTPSYPSTLSPSSSYASISSSSFDPRRDASNVASKSQEPIHTPKPPAKEFYTVSTLTRDLLGIVRAVLSEGIECQRSNVFSSSKLQLSDTTAPPSQLILQAAPSVLELYRALFAVTHAEELRQKPELAMRFSNDCVYISEAVEKLLSKNFNLTPVINDQLRDSVQKVSGLGDWWYEDSIVSHVVFLFSTFC